MPSELQVAVLGYHDGAAGQVETWFEAVTGMRIACFVVEQAEPVVVDIAAENRRRINQRTAFPENGRLKGRPLICSLDWPAELQARGIRRVLPLTPDNHQRRQQLARCQAAGFELVSAIHPSALILAEARLAPGVWIHAGCIVGYKAELASGVILNTRAQVDHHCVLETACQLDPAVVCAGNCHLQTGAHLHTGAVVINRRTIGADAIVGAGAVVIADVPPRTTVVGVPARVIKTRPPAPG